MRLSLRSPIEMLLHLRGHFATSGQMNMLIGVSTARQSQKVLLFLLSFQTFIDIFLLSISPSLLGGTVVPRRILFWFSWDSKNIPKSIVPDVDFQLNPWTLFALTHPDFEDTLVSALFFIVFHFIGLYLPLRKVHPSSRAGVSTTHTPSGGMRP